MSASDKAWQAVVKAATAGTRGKVFFMTRDTYRAIMRERRRTHPPVLLDGACLLYSLPVHFDERMAFGDATLERP